MVVWTIHLIPDQLLFIYCRTLRGRYRRIVALSSVWTWSTNRVHFPLPWMASSRRASPHEVYITSNSSLSCLDESRGPVGDWVLLSRGYWPAVPCSPNTAWPARWQGAQLLRQRHDGELHEDAEGRGCQSHGVRSYGPMAIISAMVVPVLFAAASISLSARWGSECRAASTKPTF